MNFRDGIQAFRRRWRIVVLVFVVCAAAAAAATILTTPRYTATAQIFVSTQDISNSQQLAQGNSFAEARVQSYIAAVDSPAVLDFVAGELDNGTTSSELRGMISADAPPNKVLINISAVNDDPDQAAGIANAVAQRFNTVVEGLEQTAGSATSPVRLSLLQPATAPEVPSSPDPTKNALLAILAAVALSVIGVAVRELTDNSVKTPDSLSQVSGTATLITVPFDKRTPDQAVAIKADPHGRRAEAFRQLRTALHFLDVDNPPRVVAVTSAMPGEGKTHLAVNLAAALAESGKKTCLVDADLRKPSVAARLGLVGSVGLTTALVGDAPLSEVMQNGGQNLAVLTSGGLPPNPAELLASANFKDLIAQLAEITDYVVIDTAPLLPVTDGAEVASIADATILCVRANRTSKDKIKRAVLRLNAAAVQPAGAVLSMAPEGRREAYGYYYYGDTKNAAAKQDPGRLTPSTADGT